MDSLYFPHPEMAAPNKDGPRCLPLHKATKTSERLRGRERESKRVGGWGQRVERREREREKCLAGRHPAER